MDYNIPLQSIKVAYMVAGAKKSRYHMAQWMRYLRKGISEDGTPLSQEDIRQIIDSGELTMLQIITLKRAMETGTITTKRVSALNRRTELPMLKELMRRREYVS